LDSCLLKPILNDITIPVPFVVFLCDGMVG